LRIPPSAENLPSAQFANFPSAGDLPKRTNSIRGGVCEFPQVLKIFQAHNSIRVGFMLKIPQACKFHSGGVCEFPRALKIFQAQFHPGGVCEIPQVLEIFGARFHPGGDCKFHAGGVLQISPSAENLPTAIPSGGVYKLGL
jgi:hypothetical protein